MATKGTRWFLRRSVDLIPYMLFMAAREALVPPREWPAAAAIFTQGASFSGEISLSGVSPLSRVSPFSDGASFSGGASLSGGTPAAEHVGE
jgi:hypothetical protein